MFHVAYIQNNKLVEVFTPSRFNAYRMHYTLMLAGVRPRLFRVTKGQCALIF